MALAFYLPFGLIYFIFMVWPTLEIVKLAFFKFDLFSPPRYIGIKNFIAMFTNDVFLTSAKNTLVFTGMSTLVLVPLGLALALLFNANVYFKRALRLLFFSPYVLSVSVVSLLWAWMYHPQLGLINLLLEKLGLHPIAWLSNPSTAMTSIVITTVWWTVAFNVMLFIAGLQGIPKVYYEAASIDGATGWKRFWHITLPLMRSVIGLVTVLQLISSLKIFGQVYIMTGGGPYGSTRVLVQHIYESAFQEFRLGYASAVSLLFLISTIAISILQFRLFEGRGASDE